MDFKLIEWQGELRDELVEQANNRKIADCLRNIFPHPYTKEDALEYLDLVMNKDEHEEYSRAIIVAGRLAGGIGVLFKRDVYVKTAEIGYWLGEEFWGQGLMTRAVQEVCSYIFLNRDIVRIYAEVFAFNKGSARVLEKAGFKLEGRLKNSVYKNGEIHDSLLYALIKE